MHSLQNLSFFFIFWLRKIDFDFEGKLKLVKQPIVPYSTMNSGQENTATSNVWPISWHILFGKHNLYTINAISIDKVWYLILQPFFSFWKMKDHATANEATRHQPPFPNKFGSDNTTTSTLIRKHYQFTLAIIAQNYSTNKTQNIWKFIMEQILKTYILNEQTQLTRKKNWNLKFRVFLWRHMELNHL